MFTYQSLIQVRRSYAHELAARYGISFDKIVETLTARQAIDPAIVPS